MPAPLDVALIRGLGGDDPTFALALAGALLHAVARDGGMPVLRCYRPQPTVAFGRQDAFLPGFSAAADAARSHGFTPVLRAPGGHAAAYDGGSLIIDEIVPERDSISGIHDRFAEHAEFQADVLRTLGVDAQIGKVPGEYCPGDFTVSASGRKKLIGTAQRVVKGAWLFSTVVVVEGSDRLRAVLQDVYAALELDWDPVTVGAVADAVPGIRIEDVERALLERYGDIHALVPTALSLEIAAAAERSVDRYRLTH
jgi:octanoyl-[GcvH]:protein N-octanoyltransferase